MTMTVEAIDTYLQCPSCPSAHWKGADGGFTCGSCGRHLRTTGGVLSLEGKHSDAVTNYYDVMGGPHFVDIEFEDNPHMYCATRVYHRYLGEWFPAGAGSLVDLGAGDGRFSLWALEHGFAPVIAVDSSMAALQRLVRTAEQRGLKGLVAVCAGLQDDCLRPAAFDVVFFIEALCYAVDARGKQFGWEMIRRLMKPGGRSVVSELGKYGRLLQDVVSMNVPNLRKIGLQGRRQEKFNDIVIEVTNYTPEQLLEECRKHGFQVLAARGISPVPMLFNYVYSFTSYPLRPALDADMKALIETLDDQTSDLNNFSRNTVVLLSLAS